MYTTPYQTTIAYNPDSSFETILSLIWSLPGREQLVVVPDYADLDTVAGACEYLSPDVILFGNRFTLDNIQKFLDRGFQTIKIFTNEPSYYKVGRRVLSKNSNITDVDLGSADVDLGSADVDLGSADVDNCSPNNIITFDINTMMRHIPQMNSIGMYLMEHLLLIQYPSYNSVFSVSAESGKYLFKYLLNSGKSLGHQLSKLYSTSAGFDMIDKRVAKGRLLEKLEKTYSTLLEENGLEVLSEHKILALQLPNKSKSVSIFNISRLVKSYTSYDYVVVCWYQQNTQTIEVDGDCDKSKGYYISLYRNNPELPDPKVVLTDITGLVPDEEGYVFSHVMPLKFR